MKFDLSPLRARGVVRSFIVVGATLVCLAAVVAYSWWRTADDHAVEQARPKEATRQQAITTAKPPEPTAEAKAIRAILRQLAHQKEVDTQLAAEIASDAHTLAEPLVVLDPYGVTPLSALVVFATPQPRQVTVEVVSKPGGEPMRHQFSALATRHAIPVYGLYPGETNQVRLTTTTASGVVATKTVEIATEPLPAEAADVAIEIVYSEPGAIAPGVVFLNDSKPKFAFDNTGQIRWYTTLQTLQSVQYSYRNHLVLAAGHHPVGDVALFEVDLLGRVYSIADSTFGAHHAIALGDREQLLVTGAITRDTNQDLVYSIDLASGKRGSSLDLGSVFDRERASPYRNDEDWLHLNAVVGDSSDGTILVSGRNQSAVAKVDFPSGQLRWILANHANWNPEYFKYLLSPVGTPFEWPYAQHSPNLLPDQDGNPQTVDLVLFDNHDIMESQQISAIPSTRFSRVVHYRIDQRRMTIRQVSEYGSERGNDLYSDARGVAEVLSNRNILACFNLNLGIKVAYARVIELQEEVPSMRAVFEALIYRRDHTAVLPYRAYRRELYSVADDSYVNLAAPRNFLSPAFLENYR